MVNLVLHLKREYFDQIKSGEKTEEYRENTPYWRARLAGRQYDNIVLCCGYPTLDDKENTIIRKWNGYTRKVVDVPLFGGATSVYAIDVSQATP